MNRAHLKNRFRDIFIISILLLLASCGKEEKKQPPSKQVEGRMLCASNLAYEAQADGSFRFPDPWMGCAGFTEPPVVLVSGPGNIHACLIGKNHDGIVIAFRGTLPPGEITMPVLADWINSVLLVPPQETENIRGKTHGGMNNAAIALWPQISKKLDGMQAGPSTHIYLTGHSKGGAMAVVTAALLSKNKNLKAKAVVTFGAPRAGDADFTAELSGIPIIRYENAGDLVPLLPPDFAFISLVEKAPYIGPTLAKAKDWHFSSVGELRYIQKDGSITGSSLLLALTRGEDLFKMLLSEEGASALMKAHSCGCGSAYQKAVAKDVECIVTP